MVIALNVAGGLGVFLLAMAMMTDGLKVFGGERLKSLLERWTSTSIKAALTGAMVTGVVQSSSAVTVATIGFANAGILTLRQALGVIFGANVGTTMTGWLVSFIGFGFKIETLALPIIALGMGLRVAASGKRARGLGEALAGFGLFFLGLAVLKDAFSGLTATVGTATLTDAGAGGVALFVGAGLIATVLTQSSSAAIALILTAASESALGVGAAAAAIIGANIGTTSTAAFAVIKATPNARRVAMGHIVFNVCTGIIALLILPLLLWSVSYIGRVLGLSEQPTVILALFHTAFNLVGVALLLPFVGHLSTRLERLFKTQEEDIRRPRHLDRTVAATPAFAVPALQQELLRMHELVRTTSLTAVAGAKDQSMAVEQRAAAIFELGKAVRTFAIAVRMEGMSQALAETIPRQLRISRYLEEAASLLSAVHAMAAEGKRLRDGATRSDVQRLLDAAHHCIMTCDGDGDGSETDRQAALAAARERFEAAYQDAKAGFLRAAATRSLRIEDVDRMLDTGSAVRRMVDQLFKATSMLADRSGPHEQDGDQTAADGPPAGAAGE